MFGTSDYCHFNTNFYILNYRVIVLSLFMSLCNITVFCCSTQVLALDHALTQMFLMVVVKCPDLLPLDICQVLRFLQDYSAT
jgi:hypothetical protein